MFLAASEKVCKEQGITLLPVIQVHKRKEEGAFQMWSSSSDLQKFMA